MMAFPKLVRNPKIPVRVVITQEEPNEFGERPIILDKSFRCNYQDSAAVKYTADKQALEITGTIYIDGDMLASLGVESLEFGVTSDGILLIAGGGTAAKSGVLGDAGQESSESNLAAAGYVMIFGRRREIVRGTKARNLDGSVNYTRLDVK